MDLVDVPNAAPPRRTFDVEKELQTVSEDSGRAGNFVEGGTDAFEREVSQPAQGGQSFPTPSSTSSYREGDFRDPLEDDVTLGQFIADRVGDAFKGLFRNSQTILRVDLRQALRYDVPLRRTPASVQTRRARGTSIRQPGRRSDGEVVAEIGDAQSRPWSYGLQGGGARLKLIQVSVATLVAHQSRELFSPPSCMLTLTDYEAVSHRHGFVDDGFVVMSSAGVLCVCLRCGCFSNS